MQDACFLTHIDFSVATIDAILAARKSLEHGVTPLLVMETLLIAMTGVDRARW